MQIDPGFNYYKGRSAESVARELEVNGYRIVRYVVTNDTDIDDKLLDAFHKRKIAVWYLTFGNGFYGEAAGMPAGWEKWKTGLIGPPADGMGYTFLSLSHPEYRAWKRDQIVGVMRKHAFDGVEVAEPFQMGWDGPEKGIYGDLSPVAIEAFRAYSKMDGPPDFKDPKSPKWYKTDAGRYSKWVDFRVHEVSDYLAGLVKGFKKAFPKKPFAVWALANTSPDPKRDPAALIREWQGVDAVAMVKAGGADMVCFQTNWPDWSNPELPGDYPKLYKSFTEPFKKACPKVPFIIQADTGSQDDMRRGRAWIAQFEKACLEVGGVGSTAYMYDIGLWMYTEKPEIKQVEVKGNEVLLVFQKRVDPVVCAETSRYSLTPDVKVIDAKVDGNLVRLTVEGLKPGRYTLSAKGISDDPKSWMTKGQKANVADASATFRIGK